jgi:hypothetical protein
MSWIFFTARLGSAQSALAAIRPGEPDAAFIGLADTVSLAVAEDAADLQDSFFFTGRLGWQRSKLSFVRLGEPDIAYVWTTLQAGLTQSAVLTSLTPSTPMAAADTLAIALSEIANQSLTADPGPVLVDQEAIEFVFAVIPQARLDQAALETVYAGAPSALLDQMTVELILKRGGGTAYVSGSVPVNITSFVY